MNPKLIFPALALVAIGGAIYGIDKASAHGLGFAGQENFVGRLAAKLGRSDSDVQTAIGQIRQENQAERQQQLEASLSQAVADGKITADQQQAILTKFSQLSAQHQADMDNFQNMTPKERQAARQSHHDDLTNWAKDQGIDLSALPLGFAMGQGMHGIGQHMYQPSPGN